MKLKVKDMDIATGGILVAILNEKDAEKLDLHHGSRVKIITKNKTETVVINIAESRKAVPKGSIGLYEEVIDSLDAKNGQIVKIAPARRPVSIQYIKKKLDGGTLTKEEIEQIVWDIVHNKLDATELAFFIAAGYINIMSDEETVLLTKAMAKEGQTLKFKKPVLDKHCVGGVAGNRTTMIVVPIIAAAGLTIPKTSSRSITSPAGTADTMEILAKVDFSAKKLINIVKKCKGCIVWGGAINLAPADDKIIKVERPLSIDAESQLLASILAKKASVGASHVLIDIPTSKEAKVTSRQRALHLKKDFESIGKKLGMKIKVIITDGKQPIGNGIGPALEARDVLWVLQRDERRPKDLEKKSVMMAGIMLEMAGIKKGRKKAKEILDKGIAYKKMQQIIDAQGGDPCIDPDKIKIGRFTFTKKAGKTGIIRDVYNRNVSKIARIAGAPADKGSGIYLNVHEGQRVKRGDTLFTIYAHTQQELDYAVEMMKKFPLVRLFL